MPISPDFSLIYPRPCLCFVSSEKFPQSVASERLLLADPLVRHFFGNSPEKTKSCTIIVVIHEMSGLETVFMELDKVAAILNFRWPVGQGLIPGSQPGFCIYL